MRRLFVIFLILLFPLNVLALSVAASAAQPGSVPELAMPDAGDLDAKASWGDVDPDEPPSVADLHDIVNHEASLRLGGLLARVAPPRDAARHSLALPPPIKPPCVA